MNYRETINLPSTEFSMKANLKKREPEFLKLWEEINLYKELRKRRKNKKKFILHDGPPYANGHIHLGHSLNKILKDIIIKSKSMAGYDSPFVPGWDCHGLPIERETIKRLESKKISKEELRRECRKYAEKFVNIQREEFKRLGVIGDWENPYLTMSKDYEWHIFEAFKMLAEQGYIYRAKKPVYWCIHCKTALAEAEVEYANHVSPSITVKFPVIEDNEIFEGYKAYWLIWTTTPWTLPGNVGICIHPEHPYEIVLVENPDTKKKEWWIMAQPLVSVVLGKLGIKPLKQKKIDHKLAEKLTARHPFYNRESRIVFDKYVSMETGTGCVHIAPGHGEEDYLIGLNYNLPVISPVDENGNFTDEVEINEWKGVNVFEANKRIINYLKEKGLLIESEEIEHSYPHCWRCKNPIIFRATSQWFMKIDHKELRKKCIESLKNIKWIPEWGEERLKNMLEVRPDWCLSRQRAWGVPITAFYCKDCGELIFNKEVLDKVAEVIKQEGIDAWFIQPAEKFLPENYKCPKCGSNKFEKETDILDVWFDSGVSHFAVLKRREELVFPSDVYLEGSDQYRGWFQSSLIPSIAINDTPPYKIIITHGFTLDEQGRAMHKSLGNVISPFEIIEKYGADILRLWVCSLDYRDDVRIGNEIIKRLVESYRKIRNTLRFILGNINGFTYPEPDFSNPENFDEFDRWAIAKLIKYNREVRKAYENYQFHIIYHKTVNFCATTLSAYYFDILKDRLYIEPANSFKGKSSRFVLRKIFTILIKLLAPVLSFTAEDAWRVYLKEQGKDFESIHLQEFEEFNIDENLYKKDEDKWDRIFTIRDAVNKALEEAKNEKLIGHTLEAKVIIKPEKEKLKKFLEENKNLLNFAFIVSQVEIVEDYKGKVYYKDEDMVIGITKADGKKCARCWNWSEYVGKDPDYPELCERCSKILRQMNK